MSVESAVTAGGLQPAQVIEIFINDVPHKLRDRTLTGEQIAKLGGIPEGNQIFLEVPGPGDDRPVGRNEPIELRPGMRFYDVPAGNLG